MRKQTVFGVYRETATCYMPPLDPVWCTTSSTWMRALGRVSFILNPSF